MALARRAAAILDIPFYVVDAKEAFREIVVRSFLEGYAAGQTPNPCLQCNRKIRWTLLLEHALGAGRREDGDRTLRPPGHCGRRNYPTSSGS